MLKIKTCKTADALMAKLAREGYWLQTAEFRNTTTCTLVEFKAVHFPYMSSSVKVYYKGWGQTLLQAVRHAVKRGCLKGGE